MYSSDAEFCISSFSFFLSLPRERDIATINKIPPIELKMTAGISAALIIYMFRYIVYKIVQKEIDDKVLFGNCILDGHVGLRYMRNI